MTILVRSLRIHDPDGRRGLPMNTTYEFGDRKVWVLVLLEIGQDGECLQVM